MEALAFLLVVGGALFVLGLVALKVVLALVLLPFKLLFGLLKVVLGVVGGILGLVSPGCPWSECCWPLSSAWCSCRSFLSLSWAVSSGWPCGRDARARSLASPDQRAATRSRARRSSGRSGSAFVHSFSASANAARASVAFPRCSATRARRKWAPA